MTNDMPDILYYYDKEVAKLINEKYNFPMKEAFLKFVKSKTYELLRDERLELWDFGPKVILDMWENEFITGNPRNSLYIR